MSLEAFPQGYTVICKDHHYVNGGVFLCFQKNLPVNEQPFLTSDAEVIWSKVTFVKQSPNIVPSTGHIMLAQIPYFYYKVIYNTRNSLNCLLLLKMVVTSNCKV